VLFFRPEVMLMRIDEAVIHPDLPYLHIIHPLSPPHFLPHTLTPDLTERVIDELAPAMMKCLDLAFDALRIGGGNKEGGWNLLMTLSVALPNAIP